MVYLASLLDTHIFALLANKNSFIEEGEDLKLSAPIPALLTRQVKMILCILIAKLRQVLNMRILCGGGREQRRGKGLCIRYGNDRDIHATFRYDIDSYRHQKSCATTPGGSSFFIGLRLSLNVKGGSNGIL